MVNCNDREVKQAMPKHSAYRGMIDHKIAEEYFGMLVPEFVHISGVGYEISRPKIHIQLGDHRSARVVFDLIPM